MVDGTSKNLTVIGAGTMGRGIAHVGLVSGIHICLHDSIPESLKVAEAAIQKSMGRALQKGKLSDEEHSASLQRLRIDSSLESSVHEADFVIEAVPESTDIKESLYRNMAPFLSQDVPRFQIRVF